MKQAKSKPNLLFIFTDQQRPDALGCYGNSLVQSPNVDRLAAEGCLFENAYVTQPVCTPSRASIMTGLYPHTHGCTSNNVRLRADTPTIAEMVPPDYVCGYYGKWHLGDEVIPQHGFSDWISIEDTYRKHYSRPEYLEQFSSYHHFLVAHGYEPDSERAGGRVFQRVTASQLPEPLTKARFVGHEAARFIRERREQPFVLYVNFLEPHPPYYGPLDDLYPPDQLPLAPQFLRLPADDAARYKQLQANLSRARASEKGADITSEAQARRTRARYLGNTTLVDHAVGDILAALDEVGLQDKTIVVYTSDHGCMMGDHSLVGKCVTYEDAVRVPLIVRLPWLKTAGRRIRGCVSQIDLVPTLLDLMSLPIPAKLEGVSRARALSGSEDLERENNDVFIEWQGTDGWNFLKQGDLAQEEYQRTVGPWRTIVTSDGWKLNLSLVDHCELINLRDDPGEERNLFNEPDQRKRIRDLAARIRDWQARTGDTAALPDLE